MEIKGYDNLVFFDTETTGLEADKNRIIELAAIRIGKSGKWQMDCFIKLPDGERIPDKISELTHITDEMLEENGVTEEEAAAEFSGMLMGAGNTLLIAHNAQFDLNFTAWMIARQQRPEWMKAFNATDYLDTLTIYKDRHAYPHKLANAIETYGLSEKVQNTHRAIDDCLALYEVTKALQEERSDLESYINVFGFNSRYGISGRELKKVTYRAQRFRDYMAPEDQTLPEIIAKERS